MAKKKQIVQEPEIVAEPIDISITNVLETNYMPYAMSVIVSRAIPEIDGFKPAHRKLLYTMYKMGLLTGTTQKSANALPIFDWSTMSMSRLPSSTGTMTFIASMSTMTPTPFPPWRFKKRVIPALSRL